MVFEVTLVSINYSKKKKSDLRELQNLTKLKELQNLTNMDFLAQFVQLLSMYEHKRIFLVVFLVKICEN